MTEKVCGLTAAYFHFYSPQSLISRTIASISNFLINFALRWKRNTICEEKCQTFFLIRNESPVQNQQHEREWDRRFCFVVSLGFRKGFIQHRQFRGQFVFSLFVHAVSSGELVPERLRWDGLTLFSFMRCGSEISRGYGKKNMIWHHYGYKRLIPLIVEETISLIVSASLRNFLYLCTVKTREKSRGDTRKA